MAAAALLVVAWGAQSTSLLAGRFAFYAPALPGVLFGTGRALGRTRLAGAGLPIVDHVGGAPAGRVVLRGDRAYVGAGPEFAVLDVGDPARPRRTGSLLLAGNVRDFAVVGDYAWVAAGTHGLRVLDLSAPDRPREVGGLHTGGAADSVQDLGAGRVLVWSEMGGLHEIDGRDPARPRIVGTRDTTMPARPSAWRVVDGVLWDERAPGRPVRAGRLVPSPTSVQQVDVAGGRVLVVGGLPRRNGWGIAVYALGSSGAAEARLASYTPLYYPHGFERRGARLYVTAGDCPLRIFDVTTSGGLAAVGEYCPPVAASLFADDPTSPGRMVVAGYQGVSTLRATSDGALSPERALPVFTYDVGHAFVGGAYAVLRYDSLVLARPPAGGEGWRTAAVRVPSHGASAVDAGRLALVPSRERGEAPDPERLVIFAIDTVGPRPRLRRLGALADLGPTWTLREGVLTDAVEVAPDRWALRRRDLRDPARPGVPSLTVLAPHLEPRAWAFDRGTLYVRAGWSELRSRAPAERRPAVSEALVTFAERPGTTALTAGRTVALDSATASLSVDTWVGVDGGLVVEQTGMYGLVLRDTGAALAARPRAAVDFAFWNDRPQAVRRLGDRLLVGTEKSGVFVFRLP